MTLSTASSSQNYIIPVAASISIGIITLCSAYLLFNRKPRNPRDADLPDRIKRKYALGGCPFGWGRAEPVKEEPKPAATPAHQIHEFVLEEKKFLTTTEHPVIYLTFATKDGAPLDIEPGQHVYMHFHKDDEGVVKSQKRPYSPVDRVICSTRVSFAVKVYKNGHGSQHLLAMQPGECIEFTGPSKALFHLNDIDRSCTRVFILASGSGITPFIGMLRQMCQDSEGKVKPVFVFANRTWDDVFFTEELYDWNQSGKLHVIHALSQEKEIEGDKVEKHHPDCWTKVIPSRLHESDVKELHERYKSVHNRFLLCGTPHFVRAMRAALKDLGVPKDEIKVF